MRRSRPVTAILPPPSVSPRWLSVRSQSLSFSLWLAAATGVAAGTTACGQEANVNRPWMFSESKLPEGFPEPGPVDQVVVKLYPAHRRARVQADGGSNGMFMKLFRHIKREEIAMTAPVEMSWAAAAPEKPAQQPAGPREPEAMAFLYGKATSGTAGVDPEDPRVVVEDVPEVRVVSIGLRGGYEKKTFDRGRKLLEAWLAEHPEWQPVGVPRTLAYNSPFVPNIAKYSEAQIPVEAAAK